MDFSDEALMEKPLSGKKRDLLLIMPYNSEYAELQAHIRALCRQDFSAFDLMVVSERGADTKKAVSLLRSKSIRFGTMLAKRRQNTGSAGAYFLGQQFALENGYSCVICADVDCLPESNSLVRALYSRREAGFVSATMHATKGKIRLKLSDPSVNHYTLFSRKAMEKFGLYYAPLFYYAEDGEYRERVRTRRQFVPQGVLHPLKIEDALLRQGRSWYVQLNSIHFLCRPSLFFRSLFIFLFLAAAYLVFLQKRLSSLAALSLRLLLSFSYGKVALEALAEEESKLEWQMRLPSGVRFIQISFEDEGYAASSLAKKALRLAASFLDNFRQEVVIERTYSLSKAVLVCMVAKRAYAKKKGAGYLLLCDNSSLLLHAARLVLFPLALLALLAFAGIPYLFIKAARQPNTIGYGLGEP